MANEQLDSNSEVDKPIKRLFRIERLPKKMEGGGVFWLKG
jgi:hypothetical protein